MPKRSSSANISSRDSPANNSEKRAKLDKTDANSRPNTPGGDEQSERENDAVVNLKRDPSYYFDDGSVTLRVRQVLFKIHASLLKAHSADFFNKLAVSSPENSTRARGTCDEDAIVIPDIQPSQFRHLMKFIYGLPANNLVARPATNNKASVVGNFDCYLDVALMSRKFAMEDIEKWAKRHLCELLHTMGKDLVVGFRTSEDFNDIKPDDFFLEDDSEEDILPPAYYTDAVRFMDVIGYARATSDDSLLHDILSAFQLYLTNSTNALEFLTSYFRIENLRHENPSIFGFLFLQLLLRGNLVWIGDYFTQADRVALFSAQSFLTPIPESLKESTVTPLFTRPTSASDFVGILSNNAIPNDVCHDEFFPMWAEVFPQAYYRDINSGEFSVLTKALSSLPLRRLNLGIRLRRPRYKCRRCYLKLLGQLDRDMQEVFTRLASYYNVYE